MNKYEAMIEKYAPLTDYELSVLASDKLYACDWYSKPSIDNNFTWEYGAKFCCDEEKESNEIVDISSWGDVGKMIDEAWDGLMYIHCGSYESEWVLAIEALDCSKLKAAVICYLEV